MRSLFLVRITSNKLEESSVILVGWLITCVRLKQLQKSSSAFGSGSLCRSKLQVRSPNIKIGTLNDMAGVSVKLKSVSKQVTAVSFGWLAKETFSPLSLD